MKKKYFIYKLGDRITVGYIEGPRVNPTGWIGTVIYDSYTEESPHVFCVWDSEIESGITKFISEEEAMVWCI